MKRLLTIVAVFAALCMTSCGTSAEDKSRIEDQAKKISTLEQKVTELQKTVSEQKAKSETPSAPAPAPAPGGRSNVPTKTK